LGREQEIFKKKGLTKISAINEKILGKSTWAGWVGKLYSQGQFRQEKICYKTLKLGKHGRSRPLSLRKKKKHPNKRKVVRGQGANLSNLRAMVPDKEGSVMPEHLKGTKIDQNVPVPKEEGDKPWNNSSQKRLRKERISGGYERKLEGQVPVLIYLGEGNRGGGRGIMLR